MALEFPQHKLVVAQIRTDEGVTGLGYSLVFGGGGAEAVLAYLDTRLKPLLLSEDATAVERLWEKMYRGDRGVRRVGIAGYALSALDIGLWDIAGKAARLPLYKLWGAVTDRVAAYGSGGWGDYSERDLIAEAESYAGLGCRYYKMKIHHADPQENAARRAVKRGSARLRMMSRQRSSTSAQTCGRVGAEDLDLVWYRTVLADAPVAVAGSRRNTHPGNGRILQPYSSAT